jgi:hypothetical protein
VTIEGGQGWQVSAPGKPLGPAPDTLGDDPPLGARRLPRPSARAAALLALGAVLGYAVAEVRTDRLGEGDGGVLALESGGISQGRFYDVATLGDGRLAAAVPITLINAGPRPVALREVVLEGTGFAAQDVEGRRLEPRATTNVVLLRAIDCDQLEAGRTAVPPLVVTALTDAGEREQRLTPTIEPFTLSGEMNRAACGRVPPGEALVVTSEQVRYEPRVARVELVVRNGSADVLTVRDLRPLQGLQLRLLDEQGQPVALPLRVPAGDFTQPRSPFGDDLPRLRLTAEVTIPDCSQLLRANPFEGGPLVEVDVDGGLGSGTAFFGDGSGVLDRLRRTAC